MLADWYRNLSDRERLTTHIGGLLALLLLLYLLIWQPLERHNRQLTASLAAKERLLDWMQDAEAEVKQLKSTAAGTKSIVPLQQRVNRLAASEQIRINRLQSGQTGELQVWIDRVEFNALLKLLDQLARQGGTLDSIQLKALPDVGYVKARLTVSEL